MGQLLRHQAQSTTASYAKLDRQASIDQWLHTGPSACLARDFLTWAADRSHCQHLDIPAPPRATGAAISQDQRWTLAARLLHDTTLDATDRVAGCLLLLYGQPLSRIAILTTSQVTSHGSEVLIRLGRHDAPLPGPLAAATRQLITQGRSHRGIGSPQATTWLFPGHLPGRPITPAQLGVRLRALGIYAQTARRAALLSLATQLPAAVLAGLLGLHETTAAKWTHQAGGDWSHYAAELTRTRKSPTMRNNPGTPAPAEALSMLGKSLSTSLHGGVDLSVIALWLGHESTQTVQHYLHADMALKERALARTTPPGTPSGRYHPPDQLLAFLNSL